MDIDIPSKDSYELRKSGADQIIVACDNRWALIHETPNNSAKLIDLANQFETVDLVLVEGFKDDKIIKIVCHRQANNKPLFYDENTIAIATDSVLDINIKQLDINNVQSIAHFIKDNLTNKWNRSCMRILIKIDNRYYKKYFINSGTTVLAGPYILVWNWLSFNEGSKFSSIVCAPDWLAICTNPAAG